VRRLAPDVYAVLGDTGRGVEGRPNAGFVVTREGVVVVDALASPRQAEQLVSTIRRVTGRPIAWLVLTHHHPDHHFGAVVLRQAGARVIAHPDKRVLASEGGEDALIADWVRVVGLDAMRGFEFADTPARAADLVGRTRQYLTGVQVEMRSAVEKGIPMRRAMASLPPVDQSRPVSLNSRRRRNAVRVYLEEERKYMGLDSP
jgi:hypothetical protein